MRRKLACGRSLGSLSLLLARVQRQAEVHFSSYCSTAPSCSRPSCSARVRALVWRTLELAIRQLALHLLWPQQPPTHCNACCSSCADGNARRQQRKRVPVFLALACASAVPHATVTGPRAVLGVDSRFRSVTVSTTPVLITMPFIKLYRIICRLSHRRRAVCSAGRSDDASRSRGVLEAVEIPVTVRAWCTPCRRSARRGTCCTA
jgi:hypothetical protein